MRKLLYTAVAIAALQVAFPLPLSAAEPAKPMPADAAQLEDFIRDYLSRNPEVLVDSLQKFQAKQMADQQKAQTDNIKANMGYFASNDRPVAGNPDGSVTVVEFFDYNCGYCRRAVKDIKDAIANDKDLRVVLIDVPILGEASDLAARWALAAQRQGKYFDYHVALMEHNGSKNESVLEKIAADVGLDVAKLRKDIEDPAIAETIKQNMDIAGKIGVQGTPAFLAGDKFMGGYVGYDALKQAVSEIRNAQKAAPQ